MYKSSLLIQISVSERILHLKLFIISVNIDECRSGPCQNGGACQDGVNRYTCNCLDGFDGNRCQSKLENKHIIRCYF